MENSMIAIEMTGAIDENHQLQLDGILPFVGPKRVRVIVLSPMTEENNPQKDIYNLNDGKAFHIKQ